jgi:S-DNA-T family DNA segregation ATPase FtsK/SpoIIIE
VRASARAAELLGDHLASAEDRDMERGVLVADRARLGELIWRYRRELAPLGVAAGLALVATIGHQAAPAGWQLAFVLSGILTVVWHFRASRPVERLYGVGVGLVGSVLLAVGWAVDVGHTWFLATLLAATIGLGVPWWLHTLPRGKLLNRKRAPKSVKAQAQAVVVGWPTIAEARGIAGVRLQQVVPDEFGWTMRLRIPTASKLTVRHVVAAIDGLESSFRTRRGAVRVEPVAERADVCVVRVNLSDPLAAAADYPNRPGRSIADPLRLGLHEDRAELTVTLPGSHLLLAGRTGAGKTALARVLVAELIGRPDALVWGVDVAKGGLAFLPFTDSLSRLATDRESAIRLLEDVLVVQATRAAWMAAERVDPFPVSPTQPHVVVLIDELSDLLTDPDIAELLERVVKLGREMAISAIGMTQRASADALGNSAVARSQFGVRIALACRESRDSDLILGQGRSAEGWRADRLGPAGSMLVLSDEPQHQVPRPGRSYWLPVAEARRIAEAGASTTATLEPWVVQAIEAARSEPSATTPPRRSGPKRTARDHILAILSDAGADGISGPDVVAALDGEFRESGVYKALAQLADEGLATKDDQRIWRRSASA